WGRGWKHFSFSVHGEHGRSILRLLQNHPAGNKLNFVVIPPPESKSSNSRHEPLTDGSDVLKLDEATIVGQAETPAGQSVCPGATTGCHRYNPKEPLASVP